MDCFLKGLRIKVNNAVDVIMNSPVMRKKKSETLKEDNIIQLEQAELDNLNDTIIQNEADEKNSTEYYKSTDISETLSDSEDKEQSESDSVFDAATKFHSYYYPGVLGPTQVRTLEEEILSKKLSRQVSDPGKDSNLPMFANIKASPGKTDSRTNNTDSKPESDYSKFYYISPRRDSLFDTVQLKSSMNHHLKYGDYKERLTYTVSKNVTNIDNLSDKNPSYKVHKNDENVSWEINVNDISQLGTIGCQLLNEDGEESLLEIDITDTEAIKDEKNLKQTRRQSISDRLNKRRSSEIMAEILRLSAENRRKEFKTLLNEHNKLVRSIDQGYLNKNKSVNIKRQLFTVDSVEGSSEDCATDSSNGIWYQTARAAATSENEGEEFSNYSPDEESSSVLPN